MTTWQLLNASDINLMYLLKCICLHQTEAVQTMPPAADGEASLTMKSGK